LLRATPLIGKGKRGKLPKIHIQSPREQECVLRKKADRALFVWGGGGGCFGFCVVGVLWLGVWLGNDQKPEQANEGGPTRRGVREPEGVDRTAGKS